MAGRYGPADVSVTLEDAPGGTARDISQYIQSGITAEILVQMIENTSLGDPWKRRVPTGVREVPEIQIEGDWDTTTTTGSHEVLRVKDADVSPQSVGRELVVTMGDGKTFTVMVHLMRSAFTAVNENIQRIAATLSPTGAGVWA